MGLGLGREGSSGDAWKKERRRIIRSKYDGKKSLMLASGGKKGMTVSGPLDT